jgi:hypothetical protein
MWPGPGPVEFQFFASPVEFKALNSVLVRGRHPDAGDTFGCRNGTSATI